MWGIFSDTFGIKPAGKNSSLEREYDPLRSEDAEDVHSTKNHKTSIKPERFDKALSSYQIVSTRLVVGNPDG